MKKVIVTEASWSGDEKSVNFSVYDENDTLGSKPNLTRCEVEVGNENWENENEEVCQQIIAADLAKNGMIVTNNDYSII